MRLFKDRIEAAHELARDLAFLKPEKPVVLGIPNGGVQVAAHVASDLDAALDILLIQKLAAPQNADQIVGAVDEHGRISMIQATARWHHLTSQEMIAPARLVFTEVQRRRDRFRAIIPESEVRGRTVVVIDQGVVTGATMLAAIASLRDRGARRIVVAAPAGVGKATWQLHEAADVVVIPHTPTTFKGVEHFYENYQDLEDREVELILDHWAREHGAHHAGVKTLVMRVPGPDGRVLNCEIDLPPDTKRGSGPYPVVLFAHSIESDARSPRSVQVSRRLAKRGLIGVRLDLTGHGRSEGEPEDATSDQMVSDLRSVLENVRLLDEVDETCVGLNGSGTGGMVALRLAAEDHELSALVIRGPICGDELAAAGDVKAPTLIIHAARDTALSADVEILDHELAAAHRLLVIPDSSRMFSDPISRELMVNASVDWLVDHLKVDSSATSSTAEAEAEAPASGSDAR